MTAAEAITTCFKKYITFRGRASTTEFWWFISLVWSLMLLAGICDAWLFTQQVQDQLVEIDEQEVPLDALAAFFDLLVQYRPTFLQLPIIFLTLPSLAVGSRRMHDVGNSGWRQIPILTPLVFGAFCTGFAYLMKEFGIFGGNALLLPSFFASFGGIVLAFAQYDRVGYPGRNMYGPPPPR